MEAVLTMSSRLHLEVIAEGVETEEQLMMLRRQGCAEVQGFLIGSPIPAAEVAGLLKMAHFPASSWRDVASRARAGTEAGD